MVSTPELIGILLGAGLALATTHEAIWALVGALGRLIVPHDGGVVPASTTPKAGWVRARFARDTFAGLPTTLIVIAALVALVGLLSLVLAVRETGGAIRLDSNVDAFFTPYRASWLLAGFLWITRLAVGPSLAAVLATATALLAVSDGRPFLVPLWVTFLGAQATTWSSKYAIARPRPEFLPNITEWNPSFPSGHATAATALIGFLAYVVARRTGDRRLRFECGFWAGVLIATICFSRVFLGVHFVTDVTAGVLVGLIWLLLGISLTERTHRLGREASPKTSALDAR